MMESTDLEMQWVGNVCDGPLAHQAPINGIDPYGTLELADKELELGYCVLVDKI